MANPAAKYRYIFERFDNLRLLTLIEDLRHGRMAFREWLISGMRLRGVFGQQADMCPLMHGMPTLRFMVAWSNITVDAGAARYLGVSEAQVEKFISWWDGEQCTKRLRKHRCDSLRRVLQRIWKERLEDAIAAQAVMQPAAKPTTQPVGAK